MAVQDDRRMPEAPDDADPQGCQQELLSLILVYYRPIIKYLPLTVLFLKLRKCIIIVAFYKEGEFIMFKEFTTFIKFIYFFICSFF